MVCIHCGGATRVTNSRLQKRSNQVWRRRQCQVCLAIFTSEEVVQYRGAWLVQSTSGLTPFERDRLFLSIYKSCQHRSTAITDASGLTDTIIAKLSSQLIDSVINGQDIVRTAVVALSRFDTAASTHYQAFHR